MSEFGATIFVGVILIALFWGCNQSNKLKDGKIKSALEKKQREEILNKGSSSIIKIKHFIEMNPLKSAIIFVFLFGFIMVTLTTPIGTGGDKCTICGSNASHEYQGSDYCTEHYKKAINYGLDSLDN